MSTFLQEWSNEILSNTFFSFEPTFSFTANRGKLVINTSSHWLI